MKETYFLDYWYYLSHFKCSYQLLNVKKHKSSLMLPSLASNLYGKGELNIPAFATLLQVLLSCITTFVFMWLATEPRISFMLGCHSSTKILSQTQM